MRASSSSIVAQLAIYNKTRQEAMRLAQGLYTPTGAQTALGEPTDVNDVTVPPRKPSPLDVIATKLRGVAKGLDVRGAVSRV
eukprot:3543013-Prymnesium_polylepis.1